MKPMRKSKCMFCEDGVVLDAECNKVIGRHFCGIDSYDEDTGCNPNCYGYLRRDDTPDPHGESEGRR